jgi:hypothetical protein
MDIIIFLLAGQYMALIGAFAGISLAMSEQSEYDIKQKPIYQKHFKRHAIPFYWLYYFIKTVYKVWIKNGR